MYYGSDSFGMDDLAQTEMGGGFSGMGDNSPTQAGTPVMQSGDFAQIGKTAQDISTIYANYLLAKNQICPPGQVKGANGQCMCPPGSISSGPGGTCIPIPMGGVAPGMGATTKLLLALGVGAAAIGGLVWVMKRKKGRNGGGKSSFNLDDGWRTIGE